MLQYFIHIVLFIFLIQQSSSAQNGIQNLGGATTNGIAHAGVTLDNISAMYTNQA